MKTESLMTMLDAEGYSPHDHDGDVIVPVTDTPEDPGDDALEHIRSLVAPHGWSADWTGDGNTDARGITTSDIRVTQER